MLLRQYHDPKLAQYAYLVGCQATGEALLIDPERDIDRYEDEAEKEGLRITAVAETHIHADFLSGAREFAERDGVRLYLSDEGGEVWRSRWAAGTRADGTPYDVTYLHDGDTFRIGNIDVRALHTPGHTPEHMSFVVVDRGGGASSPIGVATGDFVFVGSLGRPDLLEQAAGVAGAQDAAARELYRSLPLFHDLEDHLQVWPGHGAGSACGKGLGAVPMSTVGYEKRYNAALAEADEGEAHFVAAILSGQPEPQMYFARMKRDNRDGVPLLGRLPEPGPLDAAALGRAIDAGEWTVVDARLDRDAFMGAHAPGALYAPLNTSFNTVVGSLVLDETTPLLLIVDADRVEEAVRDLVRIGYDRIPAYATPATLEAYFASGGESASIPRVAFEDVDGLRHDPGVHVLDVRFASEHEEGHIPGSINASYTRLPVYLPDRVPAEGTLVVHCQSGARSAAAAAYLARAGRDVRYVAEPWSAWVDAGGAVERGASRPAFAEQH
jgi:hydroxyacylglutathione hydrolase